MRSPSFTGNDLVDLEAPGNRGRGRDERLLRKICSPAEREAIAAAADPDRRLWAFWAAKEAAFKARYKHEPVAFLPARIEVDPGCRTASWEGWRFSLAWQHGPRWVHCWVVPAGRRIEAAVARPSEGAFRSESLAVRWLARETLRALGYPSEAIEIRRESGPPRLYLEGSPLVGVDLSLSHDGGLVAVCLAIATG
jgi:phosphopantetheinyl transferase (holo-ACP synthase)